MTIDCTRLVVRTGAPFFLRYTPAGGVDEVHPWLGLRRRGLPLPRHATPEGPLPEWLKVLKALRATQPDRVSFHRLGMLPWPHPLVTLYSPRNAYRRRDYLAVPRSWLVAVLEQLEAP